MATKRLSISVTVTTSAIFSLCMLDNYFQPGVNPVLRREFAYMVPKAGEVIVYSI